MATGLDQQPCVLDVVLPPWDLISNQWFLIMWYDHWTDQGYDSVERAGCSCDTVTGSVVLDHLVWLLDQQPGVHMI